jgi:hypothetical protein
LPERSGNSSEYALVFIRRVHRLLGLGYARMTPGDHVCAEEEEITGDLVGAVDAVLDDPASPRWLRWYSVHEEPRVSDLRRRGKRRRRLDIRIDSAEQRPRSRFPFEAKRLGKGHGVGGYLGGEGLCCFVDGRYGAAGLSGGMLGYVQSGSADAWARKIGKAMDKRASSLHLRPDGNWREERLVRELEHTYRSGHDRPTVGTPIELYHTLLVFR